MQGRARTILTGLGITGVVSSIMIWGYRQWKLQGDKILHPYESSYLFTDKENHLSKRIYNHWFTNPFDFSNTKKYFPQIQNSNQKKLEEPNAVRTKYFIHPAYFTSKPAFAMMLMCQDLQRQKTRGTLETKKLPAIWLQLKLFFNLSRKMENLPKGKNISATPNNELVQTTPEKDKIKSDIVSRSSMALLAIATKPNFVFTSTFTQTIIDALKKNHRVANRFYPIRFLPNPYPIICMKNISFKALLGPSKPTEIKKIKYKQHVEIKKENKSDFKLFRTPHETKAVPQAPIKNNVSENSLKHPQSEQHKTKAPFKLFHNHKPKRSSVVDLHKEPKQNCCVIV